MKCVIVASSSGSGVGKGTIAASVGAVIQSFGCPVTFFKIETCLNYCADRLAPGECGETHVLADGTTADMDLGTYERFCGVSLSRKNTLSIGKMLLESIEAERNGSYNGKRLDMSNCIAQSLRRALAAVVDTAAATSMPGVVVVELGGSVATAEARLVLDGLRQVLHGLRAEDRAVVSVDHVWNGDISRVLQTREILEASGFAVDVAVYRASEQLVRSKIEKLSSSAVKLQWLGDEPNIYRIPEYLENEGVGKYIMNKLGMCTEQLYSLESKFAFNKLKGERTKKIGIVTRYSQIDCAYESLVSALVVGGRSVGVEVGVVYIDYTRLSVNDRSVFALLYSVDGIVIPGGFGSNEVDTKLSVLRYARISKIPTLGICLGCQLMAVEYARNVLGVRNATSVEFDEETANPVITACTGGVAVLGERRVEYSGWLGSGVYGPTKTQRFRHGFALNGDYVDRLRAGGLRIEGWQEDRVAAISVDNGSFYCGVQYHPELGSRPEAIDPIIIEFIKAIN